ncbi:MAG: translation initiation factor IF-3 C-terminal domain-containing protein, partial [Firmicutes bacterium]|nr:translation initiation factor IF-3 C-terminal domain-containing protein [Bacillota bacterium]
MERPPRLEGRNMIAVIVPRAEVMAEARAAAVRSGPAGPGSGAGHGPAGAAPEEAPEAADEGDEGEE